MKYKKNGKTNVKRRAATRRGKPRSLPTWAILGAGLVAGIILVLLAQLVINRTGQPDSGIRNLIDAAKQSQKNKIKLANKTSKKTETAKPKFDFYTILPEIETVISESEAKKIQPNKTEKNIRYVLQAGSFSRFQDADRLKASLVLNGLNANIQKVTIEGKGQFHRVRLGPFSNLSSLDKTNRRLKKLNIQAYLLKVKSK